MEARRMECPGSCVELYLRVNREQEEPTARLFKMLNTVWSQWNNSETRPLKCIYWLCKCLNESTCIRVQHAMKRIIGLLMVSLRKKTLVYRFIIISQVALSLLLLQVNFTRLVSKVVH